MFKKNKVKKLPTSETYYPIGTFISTPKGYFYVHSQVARLRVISDRVLDSWSPHRVVETSEEAVANLKVTAKLKFRNGSLIRNLSSGKIYLVESGKNRLITSPDVLGRIGAVLNDAVIISNDELNLQTTGEELK